MGAKRPESLLFRDFIEKKCASNYLKMAIFIYFSTATNNDIHKTSATHIFSYVYGTLITKLHTRVIYELLNDYCTSMWL